MQVTVLIAEDHSIVRLGLTSILNALDISEVDAVSTCDALKKQLQAKVYTHLILDIILADGNTIEIIEMINQNYPNMSVLIHSMQPFEVYGKIMNKLKVHSYLYKGASESDIKKHLELFIKNMPLRSNNFFDDSTNPFSSLAVRELEILHYLLNGYRTKEIASTLGLKMNTISTIKSNIFEKVKAESFPHLLQLAHVHQISY